MQRRAWINIVAGVIGGVGLGLGIGRIYFGDLLAGFVWAVLGFILIGWSVFDQRSSRPDNPESEMGGGRNVE